MILVVRSYLLDDDFDDAVTAMRRYQQDYRDEQPAWRVLRARVLLSAGQAGRVESILEGIATPEADALRMLGRLRQRAIPPGKVFEAARQRAESVKSPQDKARSWAVAVHAAEAMSSSARVALALDQGIRYAAALDRSDKLFALDARQLWAAYRRYGRLVGNNVQLLVGNDLAWVEEAEKSLPLAPIRARALLSVVGFEGTSDEIRELAHGRLATLLAREPGGFFVLRELYLDTEQFADIADVPASVRYRLADFALSRSDIELATQIMSTLDSAPAGADVFDWQLRRARILTMGGRSDAAAAVLHTLLEGNSQPSAAALDRLLQVVFDLQAVGADQEVVGVLEQVLALPISPEQRREILFWRAESWKALHKHTRAAHDFIRSATLLDPRAADPWGQTARYNAAESLSDAGLVDDARRIYRALLRITEDADRKGVLRMRLHQLWLRDAAQDNVGRD
jgi:tetratricopeptide (TPR) repeat protein